jgi:hypothetical protein
VVRSATPHVPGTEVTGRSAGEAITAVRVDLDTDHSGPDARLATAGGALCLLSALAEPPYVWKGAKPGRSHGSASSAAGSLIPWGGAPSQSNCGGCDQSAASLKSTIPPANLALGKPTRLPENLA